MTPPFATAILGYGRLGRSLGSLAERAGVAFRALDPRVDVPEPHLARSLKELVSGVGVVWVAVPLSELRGALVELKPYLSPEQVVADVCSVKLEPMGVMAEVLGRSARWAGTHPLFGPRSTGGTPRAAVCPNPGCPEAAEVVCELYRDLGCQVLPLEAEAHDRWMAETQGLALFLGRGLMDAGLGISAQPGTPSFELVRSLVAGVADEPGHLLDTVLTHNPHAATVRARLLESLEALEGAAGRCEESLGQDPSQRLEQLRGRIDVLDRRLLVVLARRAALMKEVAAAKRALGKPVRDAVREAAVFGTRRDWADELGLDQPFVDGIFSAILEYSCSLQENDP